MPATIAFESPDGQLGRNLTCCHRDTVRDLLEKIDESDGFFHTSTADAPAFDENRKLLRHGAFHNTCWSRDAGRGVIELAHLGYPIVRKVCQWLGQHMLYAPPRWVRVSRATGRTAGRTGTACSATAPATVCSRPTVMPRC